MTTTAYPYFYFLVWSVLVFSVDSFQSTVPVTSASPLSNTRIMLSSVARIVGRPIVASSTWLFSTSVQHRNSHQRQIYRSIVSTIPLYLASRNEGMASGKTTKKANNIRRKDPNSSSLFRADRVLSNRGWGSRSECFEILKQKRVFQKVVGSGDGSNTDGVEMKRLPGPSEKIPMNASLFVDGKIEVAMPPPLLRIFHKPKWMLSVMNDSKGRSHLGELDKDWISKMHPVGRLDYDTSGLLLFSSDGTLTQTLLHPSSKVQKEYAALVVGSVIEDDLRERLSQGVETTMGTFPADLISVRAVPTSDIQHLIHNIINNLPPEYDQDQLEEKNYLSFKDATELSEVRLVVEEGKHRMVRRILANSGHPVIGLKRERLGKIHLEDLKEGTMRELTAEEEAWAAGLLKKRQPATSM
jgi:23S rRNA pseudouridine2605 synthase